MRQQYLNRMGITSWRLRSANDAIPAPAAFVYQIEAQRQKIILIADFKQTATHSLQQATALVTAIGKSVSNTCRGEYVTHVDEVLSVNAFDVAIILGEPLYQHCLQNLDGASVIYSAHTINQLIDNPLLKDNIWQDMLGLQ
ncbi:MAG: DNA polymerase III subunit psi [Gammaproteobacteria bacterium]|nr:DNA polymerase III subunit psi [Gammaproteobacteria bacterium]MCH9744812.1 DNA polymerase III subunit psi [Gammaproteobacteria bacterium]